MRRKLTECCVLCSILFITLFLYGCGTGSNAVSNQKGTIIAQEETVYATQELLLPEYASFDGAYSDGNDLHYAAAKLHESSGKYETSFYTLKRGAAEPEKDFSLTENQRVQSMTMDGEGNIYYLGYEEPLQGSEGGDLTITGTVLYMADAKGVPLLTLNLSEYIMEQEEVEIQGLAVDGEQRMVLYGSGRKIYVLAPAGGLLFEARADGMIYDICGSGGKVFAAYSSIDGMEIREIDMAGKKLSSKLIEGIPGTQFQMVSDENGHLLIASEKSIYQYLLETGETVKKFDWNTYDFTGITGGLLLPYGEDSMLAIQRDYLSFPMRIEAAVFRKPIEGEEAVREKTILTLGTAYPLSTALNQRVAAFNKANTDYKIEVRDYEEDYTRLNTEIIAGKGTDMLALPAYRVDQLSARAVLEDLNLYFDGDETLNRSDFLENILGAFETEEHLYGIPINFRLDTIVGKASLLGERTGWDLDELIAFSEGFPEGTDIFDNASKSGVLHLIKYAYTSQLVDKDNTSNPLDRELLEKMLKFSNQYKNDEQYIYNDDLEKKVKEGQLILLDDRVDGGAAYRAYSESLFGEPVTLIGYPAAEGNGSLIYSPYTFAICSGSKHKDVEWEFISGLLSKETQIEIADDYLTTRFAFPVRKDALERQFVYWWKEGSWNDSIRSGQFMRERHKGLTEEELEPILHLIQNADTALRVSPDIDKIIEEEAIFYFDGTKPVEEVVDIIENRI